MTPKRQLDLWVKGVSVHNDSRDECCPDFSCCCPDSGWLLAKRLEFRRLYLDGQEEACNLLMKGSVKPNTNATTRITYVRQPAVDVAITESAVSTDLIPPHSYTVPLNCTLFSVQQKVVHKKTGGEYRILLTPNGCLLESTRHGVYVYQSLKDGVCWVRPQHEMEDGRFEPKP